MTPPLRDCQKKALEIGHQLPRFGFFFDTGTGKTRTALSIISHDLWAGGGSWLVVTPRSVIPGWLREARQWMVPAWSPTPTLLTQIGLRVQGWGGRKGEYVQIMSNAITEGAVITIVNPETYARMKPAAYQGVVVDESAIMQSEKAQITKRLVAQCKSADRVYLLSGNPSPNGPLQLWAQAHVLGAFPGKWWQWANTFGYQDKFRKWHLRKGQDQAIYDLMAPFCWYLDKSEVLDLAEVSVIRREFVPPDGGPTWGALLEAVRAEGLGCVMRWRTEASGFLYLRERGEDGRQRVTGAHVGHQARLEALEQLLDELGPAKVLIWHQFTESKRQIVELLEKRGATWTDDPEVYLAGACQVLLAHPRSIGKGTDGLQHLASEMIFYEISYSYDEYYQSLSRLHRSGQTRPVNVYVLVAAGTVDEDAWAATEKKEDLADALRRALGRTA